VLSESLIEKCCLIASPAAGNPTQYLVEQAFERAGLDWRFMTFDVDPERLGDAMRGIRALGFHGVKVGDPFQATVLEHVDDLTDAARRCGSINCITSQDGQIVGDNTEGAAVVRLVRQQVDPAGAKVVIVGAGRFARVIGMELAAAGASAITLISRNPTAGQLLVDSIQRQTGVTMTVVPLGANTTIDPDTAVLVNATSLGTTKPDAKLALNIDSFPPQLVIVETAYSTWRTWLSGQAAQKGCRTIDGLAIYVEQTALALKSWTGTLPDTAEMREAAEEFLGI
jgi:shikimate dehydrogenase